MKNIGLMSGSEVMQQPLWGNKHFKVGNTCLYFKEWIECGIMYIKDLVNFNGTLKSEDELFCIINKKTDIVKQLFIMKKYVYKRLRSVDVDIAPFVNMKQCTHFLHGNKLIDIAKCKNKDFYNMLVKKCQTRGHMESIYSREFNVHGNLVWQNIYCQKILNMSLPKLAEFNYKMLQNIVPCGYVLNKWQNRIDARCEYCHQIETTKHMIFECTRITDIWLMISTILGFNIKWKHVICGFPGSEFTTKIKMLNQVITICSYAIFKENSKCKFENRSYKDICILNVIKRNFALYSIVLRENNILRNIVNIL